MPSATSPIGHAAAPDDLDDLFNYDAGLDQNAGKDGNDENTQPRSNTLGASTTGQVNDLEEEVVVTRRRQPIAKLDEPRLLSSAGIPRLQKVAKTMKFKGKGHEFSDMSKLLHMYQIWLDDMYPRAKFADGLKIIEKLGHKKTLQMYRKGWIDEGKPRAKDDDLEERLGDEEFSAGDMPPQQSNTTAADNAASAPDDDELDALMAEAETTRPAAPRTAATAVPQFGEDDDLDALIAEAEAHGNDHQLEDDPNRYADDEEAMAEMGW